MQHPRSRQPLAIAATLALAAASALAVAPGCGSTVTETPSTATSSSATTSSSGAGGGGTCGPNQTDCGSSGCVDTLSHAGHCGACDSACAPGEVCIEGACSLTCQATQTKCGGQCVNVTSDAANCGGCGVACTDGEVCVDGACALACAGGTTKCGSACVNTANDPHHCGACESACAPGETCSGGACSLVCGPGTVSCGGSCTSTSFDPANCGVCGNACPAPPNAAPVCSGGACDYACSGPFLDCNGAIGDGCEVDAQSSASSCGACGNACSPVANGTPGCSSGTCGIGSCDQGFGDCDGDSANGCETDTQTTVGHCGACGNVCAAGELCVQGACASGPCPPSSVHYAGYCWVRTPTNTTTHDEACASIGKAPTPLHVPVVWDASALDAVSTGFNATSVGAYECCAHAMWCNAATMQCGTHKYHPNEYWNYGGYGDPVWTPVYTCVP